MEDFSNLTNIDAPTANQDLGVGRNDVTPGDGTGTELEVPWLSDLYYALYAVMDAAGIMPDGSGEGVVSSQFLDGLLGVIGLDAVGGNLTASTGAFAVSASGAGGGSVHVINSAEAVGSSSALYFGVSTVLASGSIYSQILSVITQATPSALKGELQFFTNRGDSNQVALTLTDAGAVNIGVGGILQHNGTTVLDASRNLTNIGTIGCGAITSTGAVRGTSYNVGATTVIDASRNLVNIAAITASGAIQGASYNVGATTVIDASRNLVNIVSLNLTSSVNTGTLNIASGKILQHNGTTVLDASRNLTNIGTVGCGAITSTGNIVSQVSGSGTFGGSLWSNNSAEAVGSSSALYFGVSTVLASGSIYSQIKAAITQATPSVLKGELQFFTNRGDSNQVALTLTDAGAVNIASGGVLQSNGVSVLGWEATGNTAMYLRYPTDITIGTSQSSGSVAAPADFLGIAGWDITSTPTGDNFIRVTLKIDSSGNKTLLAVRYSDQSCTVVSIGGGPVTVKVWYYASA